MYIMNFSKNLWFIGIITGIVAGLLTGLLSGAVIFLLTSRPEFFVTADSTHFLDNQTNKTIYSLSLDIQNTGSKTEENLTVEITTPENFETISFSIEPNITSCYQYTYPVDSNKFNYKNCPLSVGNNLKIKLAYRGEPTSIIIESETAKIIYPVVRVKINGQISGYLHEYEPNFGTFERFLT